MHFTTVSLKVYDTLGREITTLVGNKQEPGNHEIRFNAKNLARGIYFYRITISKGGTSVFAFTSTRKMMVLN